MIFCFDVLLKLEYLISMAAVRLFAAFRTIVQIYRAFSRTIDCKKDWQ